MTSSLIFFLLFIGTLAALFILLNFFTRKITRLERARAEIQLEEKMVFDFMHGLGEAFSEGVRSSELHRLIVEGASRVVDAHGGALYLVDRNDTALVPSFLSKGCPPLIDVPRHILDQAASMPVALESYLKLHPIPRGEGLLGEIWQSGEARLITPQHAAPNGASAANSLHCAIAAPLIYRRKTLGVLAVANSAMSNPFSDEDFTVFKNIAEQSAFALYNEAIYKEAGEKRRMDHDLEIARDIQAILLPSSSPDLEGFEIAGVNIPARQVSGDYFDYISVDGRRLGVAIADVSGKGVPASLIMAMCRSVIRSQAPGKTSAASVLRSVNRQLYPDIKEDMFISMAYLILDPDSPDITLSRAGHDAPLLYRASDHSVEKLTPKGMAVGIDSGEVFDRVCSDFSFRLNPGDCVLLYTDGATEALDENGQEYGIPRLVQGLQSSAAKGSAGVIKRIIDDIQSFVDRHPQHDDITLISIRKT